MRLNERGQQGVAAAIIGAVILLLIALVALRAMTATSGANQQQSTFDQANSGLNKHTQQTASEAVTAEAVFIPSHDVFGAANGYSFGTAVPLAATVTSGVVRPSASGCGHEVDFYAKSASHTGVFWAYVFANGTLSKYTYNYRNASGLAQGVASAPVATMPMASYCAYYVYASQLQSVNPSIAEYTKPIPDVLKQLGFPEALGGNRIVAVDMQALGQNPKTARHVELIAGNAPGSVTSTVTFTPPPSGVLTVTPSTMNFSNPNDNAPTPSGANVVQIGEGNYHRGFSVSGCGQVATLVGVSGGAITGTVSAAGETAAFSIVPKQTFINPKTCTISVSSQDQGPLTVVVTVNIPDVIMAPTSFVFATATSAKQSFGISQLGYTGNFTFSGNAACNTDLNIPASPPNPGGGQKIGPVAKTVNPCHGNYAGGWGQSVDFTAVVGSAAPPVLDPSLVFNTPNDPNQITSATETGYGGSFTLNTTKCVDNTSGQTIATISPGTSASGNFTVNPNGNGSGKCSGANGIFVTDSTGQTSNKITVTVNQTNRQTWPTAVEYPVAGTALPGCAVGQGVAFDTTNFAPGTQSTNATRNSAIPLWVRNSIANFTTAYNVSGGCYNGNMLVWEPDQVSDSYAINGASSTCGSMIGGLLSWPWQPNTATGNFAQLNGSGGNTVGTCTVEIDDGVGNSAGYGSGTVRVRVSNGCATSPCFAVLTGTWIKYDQCVNQEPGEDCELDYEADDIYSSTDFGTTWSLWQALLPTGKSPTCAATAPGGAYTGPTYTGGILQNGDGSLSINWTPTAPTGWPSNMTIPACVIGPAGH